jgi:hypothetical protein
MHPLVRLRLRHSKELSWHLLTGMLFHIGQDEEPFVSCRWERTGIIRRIAAARAGLPIKGAVLQIDDKRLLERRQQRYTFRFRQAGHRS